MQPDIGITADAREEITQGLARVLADSYTLMLKTLNFHWNVKGTMFRTLHLMFEEQYNELLPAVDMIAERILVLGHPAPASYRKFAELASIEEEDGVPAAMAMVEQLKSGHEAVARTARKAMPAADAADDQATVDLLVQRIQVHEKTAWMLRALMSS